MLTFPKTYVFTLSNIMAAHTEVITDRCVVDLLAREYLLVFVCACVWQKCKFTHTPYLHGLCLQTLYSRCRTTVRYTNCFTCVLSVGLSE